MGSIPKNPLLFGLFGTRPYKLWATIAVVAVFVGVAFDSLGVFVLKNLTDSIASSGINLSSVWFWAIAWPFSYLIAEGFWRTSGIAGMRWFLGFRSTAYQSLFEYLSLHSKEYFNDRYSGALVNKISNAVDGCQYLLERILWKFMPTSVFVLWYAILAGMNDFRLGILVFVWASIFISINIWFAKKLKPYSAAYANSQSTLKGRLVDSVSNMSLVHEYAYLNQEHSYIKMFVEKQYKSGIKNWWISEWILAANQVMIFIFLFLMVVSSVYLFQAHLISVGAVVMSISIAGNLGWQLFFIGQELKDVATYYGQTQEGLEEILKQHLIADVKGAKALNVSKGDIAFEEVCFEYDNIKVFDSFSIKIKSGQKVGLVGRSGAGKTTFVSLLLRHFDVQKGSIKIDGQDIKNVTMNSVRSAISFVPQDTSLFHRTIFENMAYGSPNASWENVIKAAKLAQAHHFIEKLPKGYETLVGERGIKLSGGQRQRIAIARAFLKNSPIVILDEATSSLDSESEQAIQTSLEKLLVGRTVIAIAHRLSTLKKMDRIVIIDDGKIVEDGEPSVLLEKNNGIFKSMWEHQVKGFIVDE
ncbi:MAG: ABC transporter ATP-binding protein [Candidatus Levybacteria bacterium]|nr:ABC transporter ATP-binding protein [Candidatus Levybacteria bacterium]